jgi:hypothetical protein
LPWTTIPPPELVMDESLPKTEPKRDEPPPELERKG